MRLGADSPTCSRSVNRLLPLTVTSYGFSRSYYIPLLPYCDYINKRIEWRNSRVTVVKHDLGPSWQLALNRKKTKAKVHFLELNNMFLLITEAAEPITTAEVKAIRKIENSDEDVVSFFDYVMQT